MKKLIFYCLFVLFCISLLFSAGLTAESSEELGKSIKVGHTGGIVTRDNIDSALAAATITKDDAFSVTFEDGVTDIESGAFFACKGLTSVVIPGSVTVIEQQVFQDCRGLKTVVIQNGVATIKGETKRIVSASSSSKGYAQPPRGAFAGCDNLESIYIPESVTTIEEKALWYYRVECPPNLTIYGSEGSYAHTFALENDITFVIAAPPDVPTPTPIDTPTPVVTQQPKETPTVCPTATPSPTNKAKVVLKVNTKKVTAGTTKITVTATKGATVSISAKGLKGKIKKVKMKEKKYTFKKLNFKKVKKGAKITCKATLKNHKSKSVTLKRK